MESALDWMKKFDVKYIRTLKSEENNPSTAAATHSKSKLSTSPMKKETGGQKTLKAYLSKKNKPAPKSEIFDETFNQADFAQITRRWKDKNTEHVAAR